MSPLLPCHLPLSLHPFFSFSPSISSCSDSLFYRVFFLWFSFLIHIISHLFFSNIEFNYLYIYIFPFLLPLISFRLTASSSIEHLSFPQHPSFISQSFSSPLIGFLPFSVLSLSLLQVCVSEGNVRSRNNEVKQHKASSSSSSSFQSYEFLMFPSLRL